MAVSTRKPLYISPEKGPVTVPVAADVARAIQEVNVRHVDELRAALEPFGLDIYDIAVPEYRRVVYID